mgnify:CR=1 FL=1
MRLVHTTLKNLKDIQNESKQHLRSGERGSQGTIEKKQGVGDGHYSNDTITEPYGHEIDI